MVTLPRFVGMPTPSAAWTGRALEVLLRPRPRRLVDAVLQRVGDDTYEACPQTAG